MLESLRDLNWLAIGAATLAYYVLGGLWFTPLFGKAWDRSMGFDRPKGHRFAPIYYVAPLVSCFVMCIATAVLLAAIDLTSVSNAVSLGAVVGLGYAAAVSFTNAVTPNTPQPLVFAAITASYHTLGITVAWMIIAALR